MMRTSEARLPIDGVPPWKRTRKGYRTSIGRLIDATGLTRPQAEAAALAQVENALSERACIVRAANGLTAFLVRASFDGDWEYVILHPGRSDGCVCMVAGGAYLDVLHAAEKHAAQYDESEE